LAFAATSVDCREAITVYRLPVTGRRYTTFKISYNNWYTWIYSTILKNRFTSVDLYHVQSAGTLFYAWNIAKSMVSDSCQKFPLTNILNSMDISQWNYNSVMK